MGGLRARGILVKGRRVMQLNEIRMQEDTS